MPKVSEFMAPARARNRANYRAARRNIAKIDYRRAKRARAKAQREGATA